jgi:hypothetical protein
MWMNSYLQDTLLQEHMAEAQREAARQNLLRALAPSRASYVSTLARRLLGAARALRVSRRLDERMATR